MFQVEDRHQYTILAVTEADEGRYTCAAENVLGQTDLVSYLTVNTSQVRPVTLAFSLIYRALSWYYGFPYAIETTT